MKQLTLLSFLALALAAQAVVSASAEEGSLSALAYSWDKFCFAETCFVGSVGRTDCAQPIVSAALIERLGEAKRRLLVTLPPGVNTERSVRIIIDQAQPIERPYTGCSVSHCRAEYDAGPELVASLKHGRILTLETVDEANSPISVAIPLVGFAEAYDGPPQEPKVVEMTQKQMQAEIKERAARCEAEQR